MNNQIMRKLNKIVGLGLIKIGRCANMAWFIFGTDQLYSLNVQCAWRIVEKDTIIMANRDFYYPSKRYTGQYEDFEWDIQGNNLFDEKTDFINKETDRNIVTEIEHVSRILGDINIILDQGGKILQLIIDGSVDEEQWRFFKKCSSEKHLVVYQRHIDY